MEKTWAVEDATTGGEAGEAAATAGAAAGEDVEPISIL
jgi:hypothetical protein